MPSTSSLVGRAVLAIACMGGFYVLAIGGASSVLWLPYAMWAYTHRLSIKLGLFCLLGALLILKAIMPRWDRFVPPGPLLSPHEHPHLFGHLRRLAMATQQQMPAEVYLIPEVNAWVSHRGGFMGFGSRRVMGLGLPLLQTLSVGQLRAVLAHEFGHFYGGDTALGPWIYKTRAAISRTVEELDTYSAALQLPFLWYAQGFLRLTHTISRQQEFAADALAVRLVGPRPLCAALQRVCGATPVYQDYWIHAVVPFLKSASLPSVTNGFQQYLASADVAATMAMHVIQELADTSVDLYDTHPTLGERLAAVQHWPDRAVPVADPPAVTLLSKVHDLEEQLFGNLPQAMSH